MTSSSDPLFSHRTRTNVRPAPVAPPAPVPEPARPVGLSGRLFH